jgi:hypothetical protein
VEEENDDGEGFGVEDLRGKKLPIQSLRIIFGSKSGDGYIEPGECSVQFVAAMDIMPQVATEWHRNENLD